MIGYFNRRVMPLQKITREHGIKAYDNTILAAFTRRGYYYYLPNYKPFLSETTKRE